MTDIQHSIDWLQYSVAWPNEVREWPIDESEQVAVVKTAVPHLHVTGLPPMRLKEEKVFGMQGYPQTYNMLYCTAHVNPRYREQKIGVRFTGEHMQAWRAFGQDDMRLVNFVKDIRGKASRIDIAFDLFDMGIDPMRIWQDWKSGKVKSTAQTCHPVVDTVRHKDGVVTEASTLYIGSRTSEVMFRIYEKGKQMGVEKDWVRFEVELKGRRAEMAIEDIARSSVEAVGRAIIEKGVDMPYKFYKTLLTGATTALTTLRRKETDTQLWIRNVVLPLLAQEMLAEFDSEEFPYSLQYALESMISKNWSSREQYIRDTYYPGLRT